MVNLVHLLEKQPLYEKTRHFSTSSLNRRFPSDLTNFSISYLRLERNRAHMCASSTWSRKNLKCRAKDSNLAAYSPTVMLPCFKVKNCVSFASCTLTGKYFSRYTCRKVF